MRAPLIRRTPSNDLHRKQRGVTLALVAGSMVAIISMAALSIDVGTFYQAKAEAQRNADAAALTGARVISLSGITGDPTNSAGSWQAACGGSSSTATVAATAIANVQWNFVSGVVPPTVSVTYGSGANANTDCTALTGSTQNTFSVNPTVNVTITSTTLPIFFSRIFSLFGSNYGGATVSASATAEVYNPSGSGALSMGMVPVQPRCVKPWILPNLDPDHTNPDHTNQPFINLPGGTINGTIYNPGIWEVNGGVIGETINMAAACSFFSGPNNCFLFGPPVAGQYIPALVSGNASAVPSCAPSPPSYQSAIAGCDQTTVYACGTQRAAQADLTENPNYPSATTGDTATAVACLTQSQPEYSGSDTLQQLVYPFQIDAGQGNPLVAAGVVNTGDQISGSNSIVSLPIYDNTAPLIGRQPQVTVVGFLQVFINGMDPLTGKLSLTVMNVSGCGNAVTAGSPAINGTSPVPVRLITPP